jgi:acyl-CoA synthetase (AMP-forming)/AMP-acid ligase II
MVTTAGIPRTTLAVLRAAAASHGHRDAIVMGTRRLTYSALLQEVERYAAALQARGIGYRDHVGLLMPNCVEYLLLFYACAALGARAVHLNSRYKVADLRYVIPDSDSRILITSAKQREFTDFAALLAEAFPPLRTWSYGKPLALPDAPKLEAVYCLHADGATSWGSESDLFKRAASRVSDADLHQVRPDDIGLIMYTSGTTAHPKACMLSQTAIEGAGHAFAERWHITADDRFWDPLPFFHMSTVLPMSACRAVGATFIAQEHFDARESLREIERERATILFPSFPTLTNALFESPDFSPRQFATVRLLNNVGPPDLLRRYAALLPQAVHASAYGLTEAGGVIAFSALDDSPELLATTGGKPFNGIEVKIVEPESLADLPIGERGEIWIRGPTNFSGYYKDDAKTREVVMPGGWLRSGDLGALEPTGHIRYLGRIKDMLKVGGENVAAIEIESYLCTHPAVKVAQVIGVPDERLQEVAAAFLELRDGANLTPAEVLAFCHGRIASYKIPRFVYFVNDWPMSATKIQKFRLRERVSPGDRLDLPKARA